MFQVVVFNTSFVLTLEKCPTVQQQVKEAIRMRDLHPQEVQKVDMGVLFDHM